MSTRAEANRMSRRAAAMGERHPAIAARFYDRASTAFSALGDHGAARDAAEAAEAHRCMARQRTRRAAS